VAEIYRWLDGSQLCSQSDPELWFSDLYAEQQKAIAICQHCPLQMDCLQYAIENRVDGIWGGMRESTRNEARRKLKIKAKPMRPTAGFTFKR
jgi:WhiB family redox-sensing transcriptional regulator